MRSAARSGRVRSSEMLMGVCAWRRSAEQIISRVTICAVLGSARFRALALLVCVLFARPLVTLGCVLHAPRAGNVPAHEIAIVAHGRDDDDASLEGIFVQARAVPARQ